MDRVQAGATDADDADRGDVRGALGRRHAVKLRRRFEHRLEVPSGGTRRGGLGQLGLLLDLVRYDNRGGLGDGRLGDWFLREVGHVLDGLVERGLRARVLLGHRRRGVDRLALRALRGLGLAEELRERTLTHRRALARHRAPPSRGRDTPVLPAPTGRT